VITAQVKKAKNAMIDNEVHYDYPITKLFTSLAVKVLLIVNC